VLQGPLGPAKKTRPSFANLFADCFKVYTAIKVTIFIIFECGNIDFEDFLGFERNFEVFWKTLMNLGVSENFDEFWEFLGSFRFFREFGNLWDTPHLCLISGKYEQCYLVKICVFGKAPFC
jgi:hypothetical protein